MFSDVLLLFMASTQSVQLQITVSLHDGSQPFLRFCLLSLYCKNRTNDIITYFSVGVILSPKCINLTPSRLGHTITYYTLFFFQSESPKDVQQDVGRRVLPNDSGGRTQREGPPFRSLLEQRKDERVRSVRSGVDRLCGDMCCQEYPPENQ